MYYMKKETKDAFIIVRVTKSEKKRLTAIAKDNRQNISEYMREIIEDIL